MCSILDPLSSLSHVLLLSPPTSQLFAHPLAAGLALPRRVIVLEEDLQVTDRLIGSPPSCLSRRITVT